jgi:hypothetical protein
MNGRPRRMSRQARRKDCRARRVNRRARRGSWPDLSEETEPRGAEALKQNDQRAFEAEAS